MIAGIYSIRSPSGNRYIGSSNNIMRRWYEHKSELSRNVHHSQPLQNAALKYGIDSLVFKILLICDETSLLMYEQAVMDLYQPEYNVLPMAGRRDGWSPSDETRARMSASAKARVGRSHSEETKAKISKAHKTRGTVPVRSTAPMSDETKRKIAASAKLRVEHLELMRQTRIGHKPSEETRAKRSASMTGKVQSEETKRKRALTMTGRPLAEETKRKLSIANKGRKMPPRTPEHMEKIRLAKLAKKNEKHASAS